MTNRTRPFDAQVWTYQDVIASEGKTSPTAQVFAESLDPRDPVAKRLVEMIGCRDGPAPAARGRTLRPGAVRYVTYAGDSRFGIEGHSSLLVLGDVVPDQIGPHQWAKADEDHGSVDVVGLDVPGAWGDAAAWWLKREGYPCVKTTRMVAAGYVDEALDGESAGAAMFLAIVGLGLGRGLPDDLVPSASLQWDAGTWKLAPVGFVAEKRRALPPGCRLVVSSRLEKEFGQGKDLVYCDTVDDLVALAWPDLEPLAGPCPPSRYVAPPGGSTMLGWRFATALLVGATLAEIGVLQEWGPPKQHPGEVHPGWAAPTSLVALAAGILAGLIGAGASLFWTSGILGRPSPRSRHYLESAAIWCVVGVASFALILLFCVPEGGLAKRSPPVQIFKALAVLGLQVVLMVWPVFNAAAWAKSYEQARRYRALYWLLAPRSGYPGPSLVIPNSRWHLLLVGIFAMGLGMLQWISVMDPNAPAYLDPVRRAHIVVQALLLVALAGVSWALLRRLETLCALAKERTGESNVAGVSPGGLEADSAEDVSGTRGPPDAA